MKQADNLGLILRALDFASDKHRDQRRKDVNATPYINHPIDLANVLVNEGGVTDTDVIVAALLHDTVEDTETTFEELNEYFGAKITGIVREVTDDKCLEKHERKQHQVNHAPHISDQAKLVKLADKICNLRDITADPPAEWSTKRKREYFDWAKRVVNGLRGVHPMLEAAFDAVHDRGEKGREQG